MRARNALAAGRCSISGVFLSNFIDSSGEEANFDPVGPDICLARNAQCADTIEGRNYVGFVDGRWVRSRVFLQDP
jgi:hypothetical protein